MNPEWKGILKIVEAKQIRNGHIIWQSTNLYNTIHTGGEEMILKTLFYNDGTMPPSYYYLGLDNRASISYANTMNDLVDEPAGSGYTRQQLSSSTTSSGWAVSSGSLLHKAVSNIVSFQATSSYGPVGNLFLTDKSNNTGYLISSVALTSSVTMSPGDVLSLRMTLSLRDCP